MSNKLVDICVNLMDKVFFEKENVVIEEAKKNNVFKMVLVGNDLDSSKKAVAMAEEFNFISTAGYHPHNAKEWTKDSYKSLLKITKSNYVKAIGECGLDFKRNFSPPETQNKILRTKLNSSEFRYFRTAEGKL